MARNLFNSIQLRREQKNVFDLSHEKKFSAPMGALVPCCCVETIPGDKFYISTETLVKMAPMIAPPMEYLGITIDYWFVPNRILWDGWEKFITPTDTINAAPEFPTMIVAQWPLFNSYTAVLDYFDVPPPPVDATSTFYERISMLPSAGYYKIWFEFYRDQNLQPGEIGNPDLSEELRLVDGDQLGSTLQMNLLRYRAWRHDYFTSALPFAQAGTSVNIPLADVELKDPESTDRQLFRNTLGNLVGGADITSDASGNIFGAGNPGLIDPNGTLGVGQSSINDLRRATKLQEWLERLLIGGKRYKETIMAFFGVDTGDARLQRPELIFRHRSPIVIGEVLNTTGTEDAPQGQMSGHGMGYAQGKSYSYFCREHGFIIGIFNVQPDGNYGQGIPKHFLKYSDALQYYFPQFANIGEQEIQNREIYAYTAPATGDGTFGYIPRYAEYKFQNNTVSGPFRDTLDFWTMYRKFSSMPVLNDSFITCVPTNRIFAVADLTDEQLYVQHRNNIKAVRAMPKYGTGRL